MTKTLRVEDLGVVIANLQKNKKIYSLIVEDMILYKTGDAIAVLTTAEVGTISRD